MTLVDAGGNPVVLEDEKIEYSAGGLRLPIPADPAGMLQRAVAGAQQMIAQQVAMSMVQQGATDMVAQAKAHAAANRMRDPFAMEPCALAVYMLLSREVEYRDRVIADLSKRLDALDGQTTDLEHPYPPDPLLDASEDDEDGEDDAGGGDAA